MKVAVKSDLKSKTLCTSKSFIRLRENELRLINFKVYQKLFVIFISLSTILIFPESPRELEKICETYNSTKLCSVW